MQKLEIEIAVEKVKKNFVLNLGENRNRNVGRGNIVDVDDNFDGRVVLDRFVKRVLKFL